MQTQLCRGTEDHSIAVGANLHRSRVRRIGRTLLIVQDAHDDGEPWIRVFEDEDHGPAHVP